MFRLVPTAHVVDTMLQSLRNLVPSPRFPGPILGYGLLMFLSGCAICASPYDEDYGGFVAKTPRNDMRYGRVGSPFSDPESTETPIDATYEELEPDPDGVEIPDLVLP